MPLKRLFTSWKSKRNRTQYLYIKKGVDFDMMFMNPKLVKLLGIVLMFCKNHDITCELTSVYRTAARDAQIGAVSNTHSTDRAFDLSLKESNGFTKQKIIELEKYVLQNAYETRGPHKYYLGAISKKTKKHRPIYIHGNSVGDGIHAHLQVSP